MGQREHLKRRGEDRPYALSLGGSRNRKVGATYEKQIALRILYGISVIVLAMASAEGW